MVWFDRSKSVVGAVGVCVSVGVLLAACSGGGDQGVSSGGFVDGAEGQSVVELADDVVAMSGGYQMTREGKLLKPASDEGVSKPELSDIAKVYNQNGAEAFARHFIDTVEYTWNSGDTSLLKDISLPSCTWCEYMARTTDEDANNKGWVEGLHSTINAVEPAFEIPGHPGLWHVVVYVENDEYNYYDGKTLHSLKGKSAKFQIQLRYQNDAWHVSEAVGEEENIRKVY